MPPPMYFVEMSRSVPSPSAAITWSTSVPGSLWHSSMAVLAKAIFVEMKVL